MVTRCGNARDRLYAQRFLFSFPVFRTVKLDRAGNERPPSSIRYGNIRFRLSSKRYFFPKLFILNKCRSKAFNRFSISVKRSVYGPGQRNLKSTTHFDDDRLGC